MSQRGRLFSCRRLTLALTLSLGTHRFQEYLGSAYTIENNLLISEVLISTGLEQRTAYLGVLQAESGCPAKPASLTVKVLCCAAFSKLTRYFA